LAPGSADASRVYTPSTVKPPSYDRAAIGSRQLVTLGGPAVPYDPTYRLLVNVAKVWRLVEALAPDVLEVHSPYVAAAAAASLPKKSQRPVRTTTWHSDFIDTYDRVLMSKLPNAARSAVRAPLWAYVRKITRSSARVFVASKLQTDKLREMGVDQSTYLPFGVDKEVFCPEPDAQMRTRPNGSRIRFLAIGRLAIEKRFDVVIDAFRILRSTYPQAELWVLGDGPERARLTALAGEGVSFLGFEKSRARLAEHFRKADVLLHACPYETFGLGVAEALACALPAVLPDQGGASEWPDSASLVKHQSLSAIALAQAAAALIGRDQAAVARSAFALAKSVRSHTDYISELLANYEDLLARARLTA
jgi:alpha-1,6-mannosyltransferase